ncbi:ubiquitin-like domain-containing protein [Candidatus Saccharibacteria bacterium]|nr:ubiquitin-like domain-containing protein [Candidatus Saccharibacteria bacterium]
MRVFVRQKSFLALFALGTLVLLALVLVCTFTARATDGNDHTHLVTIYDSGQRYVVKTSAKTVKEALKESNVEIDAKDNVEPSLNEEIVSTDFSINIYRARPVLIVDGNVRVKVLTAAQTNETIADAAGIKLYPEDEVKLEPTNNLVESGVNMQLSIKRAKIVNVNFYGEKMVMRTQSKTVGQFLDEKKLARDPNDFVSKMWDDDIVNGMTIEIWRNGKNTLKVDEDVPFSVEQIRDYDREVGYKQIKTLGKNGKKTAIYEVNMFYGHELSRKLISQAITLQPVTQVEVVGAKISNTFRGSFAEALAKLRSCEGGYSSNTGNGYYGAYQFDIRTWGNYAGYANAAAAPPSVQDEKAWLTYKSRGWNPWPACSNNLGLQDIYR